MGVYANGHLIYGFINDDDTEKLFESIQKSKVKDVEIGEADESEDAEDEEWEEDEESSIEEMYTDLQAKHSISMFSVGYAGIDILAAFSVNASHKGFESQHIPSEDIAKVAEYDKNIQAFLAALDIDPTPYTPGWHILGYMD